MLSVLAKSSETAAPRDYRHRSHPIAHDLRLFTQPRLGVALDSLLDELRRSRDKADFDRNRPGIANIILLGHHMGLVSEQDIDRCVPDGWADVYRVYRKAMGGIVNSLENEATMIAGKSLKHNDFESLHIAMDKEADGFYLYLSCNMRFTQFALTEIDDGLGRMVYGCLHWIVRDPGFGILTEDLIGNSLMLDNELDTYKQYREEYPELDHEQLAKRLLEGAVYPFCEFTDDKDYLMERFEFLKSIIDESVEKRFGTVPSMDDIRATVIRWRYSNRVLYDDPWTRFIKQTVKAWKWSKRCTVAGEGEHVMADCGGNRDDMPLDYGHAIGLGLPWESRLIDGVYQDISEAGETPMARIRLQPVALPRVAEKLKMLAKARGLIRLAEVINFGLEETK